MAHVYMLRDYRGLVDPLVEESILEGRHIAETLVPHATIEAALARSLTEARSCLLDISRYKSVPARCFSDGAAGRRIFIEGAIRRLHRIVRTGTAWRPEWDDL